MSPSIRWTFEAWLLQWQRRLKAPRCNLRRVRVPASCGPRLLLTAEIGHLSIRSSSPILIPHNAAVGEEAEVTAAVAVEEAVEEAVAMAEVVAGEAEEVTAVEPVAAVMAVEPAEEETAAAEPDPV
jgi:hypothetical protein